jgi:hypothetical protein
LVGICNPDPEMVQAPVWADLKSIQVFTIYHLCS